MKDEYSKRLSKMKIGGLTPKEHFDTILAKLDKELKGIEVSIVGELDKAKTPEAQKVAAKLLEEAVDGSESDTEDESEDESEEEDATEEDE